MPFHRAPTMEQQNWAGPELDGPRMICYSITPPPYGVAFTRHSDCKKHAQPQVGSTRLKSVDRTSIWLTPLCMFAEARHFVCCSKACWIFQARGLFQLLSFPFFNCLLSRIDAFPVATIVQLWQTFCQDWVLFSSVWDFYDLANRKFCGEYLKI